MWVSLKVILSGPLGLLYALAALLVPEEPLPKRIAMGLTGVVLVYVAVWSVAQPILRVRRIRRAGHDHRRWIGGRPGVD